MTEKVSPDVNSTPTEGSLPSTSQEEDFNRALEEYPVLLREKILFGLKVYPFIGRSMLHQFLQTSTPASIWKPILNELIAEGLVIEEEVTLTTPHERTQTYNIIHLACYTYLPYNVAESNEEVQPNPLNK